MTHNDAKTQLCSFSLKTHHYKRSDVQEAVVDDDDAELDDDDDDARQFLSCQP